MLAVWQSSPLTVHSAAWVCSGWFLSRSGTGVRAAGLTLTRTLWTVARRVGEYGAMTTHDGSVGLTSVAPVFSTVDVSAWLDHYRELGFTTKAHDDEYGFAVLGPIQLHVSRNPHHDPLATAGCAYLYVDDADAVWRRWSMVSGGRSVEPVDTDYGMREGAHVDPDGNLLRYGSALSTATGVER